MDDKNLKDVILKLAQVRKNKVKMKDQDLENMIGPYFVYPDKNKIPKVKRIEVDAIEGVVRLLDREE